MKHPEPRGFSRRQVQQLLSEAKDHHPIGKRIDVLSRHFLGHPYQENPLIGSADRAEVLVASLDGFDCVTYIETVLALARASDVDDFIEWLRKIRYEKGCIQWKRRNHYMTLWIRNNLRAGIVTRISMRAVPKHTRQRVLNVVPGLAVRSTRVRCIPKPAVAHLTAYLQSGDLIFFVSTRKNLDMFHAGVIVRDGKSILMRHASLSQGTVVEKKLTEFLQANRMAGVVVVRPRIPSSPRSDARRRSGM